MYDVFCEIGVYFDVFGVELLSEVFLFDVLSFESDGNSVVEVVFYFDVCGDEKVLE